MRRHVLRSLEIALKFREHSTPRAKACRKACANLEKNPSPEHPRSSKSSPGLWPSAAARNRFGVEAFAYEHAFAALLNKSAPLKLREGSADGLA